MPAVAPPATQTTASRLAALGARLRAHRKALKVSATTAAEAAGMSRVTLHRIERGEPSVTMGAYLNAIVALGLDLELVDPRAEPPAQAAKPPLPRRIRLADCPQLRRLAWQLGDVATLTPKEALALYERNWRHLDQGAMGEAERDLVRRLVAALGGARLLV